MREKDIHEAEVNFYNQLQSDSSRWAVDVSMRSMLDNIQLGENDVNDIIEDQRSRLLSLQDENDILKEEKRLAKIRENKLNEDIEKLKDLLGDDLPADFLDGGDGDGET